MADSPSYNIDTLGQVFTPARVVDFMRSLIQRDGRVLEPACGDGAFADHFVDHPGGLLALEIDARHAPHYAHITDFFALPEHERFATIIGNPPYVRYQDIDPVTRDLLDSTLFDTRSNLYLFFIEKCVRHLEAHGELIFITPRDFLKTTSSVRLNQWLYTQGSITHAVELGDARVFADAVPNCLIWRFEKGLLRRDTLWTSIGKGDDLAGSLLHPQWQPRRFLEVAGQLLFTRQDYPLHLSDIARVRVGAVSGLDDVFADPEQGNRDFVYSGTAKSGQTRRMIWQPETPHPALVAHKLRLLQRKVIHFDESNWWQWGRGFPDTDAPRVYVNGKTRLPQPFFCHPCTAFDGAVLAIFPHDPRVDIAALRDALNTVDWEELGFRCDGRFLFTQRSLQHAPLPEALRAFLPAPDLTT